MSPAHSSAADWSPLWTSPTSESDAARERRGRLRAVGRSAAARLPGGEGGTESASSRLAEEVDARQQAAMAAADAAVARLHAELAQEEADSQRRREKLKEQAAAAAASEAHERALQALTAGDTLTLALALSLTLALALALALAVALALALTLARRGWGSWASCGRSPSSASRLHLPYISPIYLPYISPRSPSSASRRC